jgi:hypothetical protein
MKRISALASLALAASLATSLAVPGARAQDLSLKAHIPFQFTVDQATMPAGDYLVSSPVAGVIRVQNLDKDIAAEVVTRHDFQDPKGADKLVFNKYRDQYFLHTVVCAQRSQMNVDLPTQKAEKRARDQEAKLNHGVEQVLIAAR